MDDEPLNLQVFDYNFGLDFSLLFANNADEALTILRDERIAVVVADHRMPGMLGLDLLQLIAEERPEIVRILLTAHTDVPLLIDAVNRGVLFRYIAKPWDTDGMRQDITLAVQRHLLEDENLRLRAAAAHNTHPPDSIASALVGDLGVVEAAVQRCQAAIGNGDLEAARQACQDTRLLLGGLLDDTRRESRRRFTTLLTLDPNELVLAALATVRHRVMQGGVSLETSLTPGLPRFLGTRDGVIEALSALLRNAVDAVSSRDGRRGVTVETAAAEGHWVRFTVRDTGPGFGGRVRALGTRTFFSTNDRPGLGLAVARAIADAHGGRLTLAEGPEAAVHLELPAGPSY